MTALRYRSLLLLAAVMLAAGGCALLQDTPGEEALPPVKYSSASDLYAQAMADYDKGNFRRAAELLHIYVGEFPDTLVFKAALYNLGYCYQRLRQDREALALYNRVVMTYGDDDFWGQQAMKRIKQIKGSDQ